MDSRQLFKEPALKEEFLDRFAELKAAASAAGGDLEGLEGGGYDLDDARGVAESMAEGSYDPGTEPGWKRSSNASRVRSTSFKIRPSWCRRTRSRTAM